MAEFLSASMRAAGSDLTISISPLGLIELSDEEFEVHGPRLTRYAQNWAFYLGHHWAYRRVAGEPQLVFNYVKAMSDYLNNFTFGKGMDVQSDKRYQHIVPALVDRLLTRDNHKEQLLWAVGNLGSVSGDAFVKIAYEDPWVDGAGVPHNGRVRILPLNPAFCFPEWAPHDLERLIRFKLKYRFWGTSKEGTRQVHTYTEILTDDVIEEWVDDTLLRRTENPLGVIPIVHIANAPAASSPWGLSDVVDILTLNRQYNETGTAIADIINYYTEPVTVLIGAKSNNLQRGDHKIWGIPQADAKVQNLSGGEEGLQWAFEFLDRLKAAMHEMMGIPQTALGEEQAISNTSGVALSIQFMPLMIKYRLKIMQYGEGWKQIIRLALMTLFMAEPDTVWFDPDTDGIIEDPNVQKLRLDPFDPVVYDLDIQWPLPLPVDLLAKLNEITMKMQLGLESKVGALKDLGEEFPDEKRLQIFEEQIMETKMDGAKQILKAGVAAACMQLGVIPEGAEPTPPGPTPNADGSMPDPGGPPDSVPTPDIGGIQQVTDLAGKLGQEMIEQLTTLAYATKIPQARRVGVNSSSGNQPD